MRKFNTCPHCHKKISFIIEPEDIDTHRFPAPVYIFCNFCNKISTFFMDSRLQVSYKEHGKKKSIDGTKIKIIKTEK